MCVRVVLTKDVTAKRVCSGTNNALSYTNELHTLTLLQPSFRYFRRKGRTSCPPPEVLVRELYDIYRCFEQMDDPERPGCKFFNGDHLTIFKKQMRYVQRGLLSDPPGRVMYVHIKTLTTGFEVYRCMRSTSLLEGYHLHLRRIIDMCARHASLRYVQNASIDLVYYGGVYNTKLVYISTIHLSTPFV